MGLKFNIIYHKCDITEGCISIQPESENKLYVKNKKLNDIQLVLNQFAMYSHPDSLHQPLTP